MDKLQDLVGYIEKKFTDSIKKPSTNIKIVSIPGNDRVNNASPLELVSTDGLPEGSTHLYFTSARVNALTIRTIEIQFVADAIDVDVTYGIGYFNIPPSLDGMNLIYVNAFVTVAGITNATTIQIRNLTKYVNNDTLSEAISIESNNTVGTPGIINTSYDNISTNDLIKVYIVSTSTTKPKGIRVICEYQLP